MTENEYNVLFNNDTLKNSSVERWIDRINESFEKRQPCEQIEEIIIEKKKKIKPESVKSLYPR